MKDFSIKKSKAAVNETKLYYFL